MGPTDEVLISIVRSRQFMRWLRTILLLVATVAVVRSSFVDVNLVPTQSMLPTILAGDYIVVNKLAFDLKIPLTRIRLFSWAKPRRGDVVVLDSPLDGLRLVKRVVAVGGDRVALQDNRLVINGVESDYTLADLGPPSVWIEKANNWSHSIQAELDTTAHDFAPVTIQADAYFVMGDNRDGCLDSRFFGTVPRRAILGRVRQVIYSIDPATWFHFRPRWWTRLDDSP